ncbi:MAG: thiol peroxidase [Candidatus Dadabacteria bacterium]|nr:thiol peroxidase [Candidatus Dadabacteria bacterium]NIQ13881.1 thiol peroxidase [Candidatus Dadabacteria bacterium]
MSDKRTDVVTIRGNPLTLLGPEIKVGDKAPDFKCNETLADEVSLASFEGKNKIFNVIGSIDTGVCQTQTKRFNQEATSLNDDVEILTISMDLPFALNRFCGAEGIEKVRTASDYKNHSFGNEYGVLIEENGLLARSIFVVDKDNIVRHVEYVNEFTNEPDYEAALEVVRNL